MNKSLSGKQVLILASSGVDESVMSILQRDLLKAGASPKTISTTSGLINSWKGKAWGIYFTVDANVNATLGSDFDMLIVPSGKLSIDKLASNEHTSRIISHFVLAEKPMVFMGESVEIFNGIVDNKEEASCVIEDVSDAEKSVYTAVKYLAEIESLAEEEFQEAA